MNRRISILFPISDLAGDGAQQQLLELVRGIDKSRFHPIVLTLQSGGSLEREFSVIDGTDVISMERKGKFDLLCVARGYEMLRRREVDVVQPFLTPATFFGFLLALIRHAPVKILTERNGPENRNTGGLGSRVYLKAEDWISRFVDVAVANSQAGKEYLTKRGIEASRIRVIYNGINLRRLVTNPSTVEQARLRLASPPGGKVVGMVARMFAVKNHRLFLRAASLVSREMPDTRFALVGDGPLRSDLEKLSLELGLASQVVFFGEQRDVGSYLSLFDIATRTSNAEGCCNGLLEPMALGKPAVATMVGGNAEVIDDGETGILVPADNPEVLAQALLALIRDPVTTESMGRRARQKVISSFSVDSMVRQYEDLYQETLRVKTGHRKQPAG